MVIFEYTSIALRCLDKSFTLMEMVREMNSFADSGTAGIDLGRPSNQLPRILGRCNNGNLVFMGAHINFTLLFNLDMPVLSIILCSRGTARSTETTDFLMFFLLPYACRPNRAPVTEDMLI